MQGRAACSINTEPEAVEQNYVMGMRKIMAMIFVCFVFCMSAVSSVAPLSAWYFIFTVILFTASIYLRIDCDTISCGELYSDWAASVLLTDDWRPAGCWMDLNLICCWMTSGACYIADSWIILNIDCWLVLDAELIPEYCCWIRIWHHSDNFLSWWWYFSGFFSCIASYLFFS